MAIDLNRLIGYLENKLPFRSPSVIGDGKYGPIFLAEKRTNATMYILKCIDIGRVDAELREPLNMELAEWKDRGKPGLKAVGFSDYYLLSEENFVIVEFEYRQGFSFKNYLNERNRGLLSGDRAHRPYSSVVKPMLHSLIKFHRSGLVHGDLSPADFHASDPNSTDFELVDWGNWLLADLPSAGIRHLSYRAPEQLAGNADIDKRADVSAIGMLLYEAFAGQHPLEDCATQADIRARIESAEEYASPDEFNPNIDPKLSAIIGKTVSKRPEERYSSVKALNRALKRWESPIPWKGIVVVIVTLCLVSWAAISLIRYLTMPEMFIQPQLKVQTNESIKDLEVKIYKVSTDSTLIDSLRIDGTGYNWTTRSAIQGEKYLLVVTDERYKRTSHEFVFADEGTITPMVIPLAKLLIRGEVYGYDVTAPKLHVQIVALDSSVPSQPDQPLNVKQTEDGAQFDEELRKPPGKYKVHIFHNAGDSLEHKVLLDTVELSFDETEAINQDMVFTDVKVNPSEIDQSVHVTATYSLEGSSVQTTETRVAYYPLGTEIIYAAVYSSGGVNLATSTRNIQATSSTSKITFTFSDKTGSVRMTDRKKNRIVDDFKVVTSVDERSAESDFSTGIGKNREFVMPVGRYKATLSIDDCPSDELMFVVVEDTLSDLEFNYRDCDEDEAPPPQPGGLFVLLPEAGSDGSFTAKSGSDPSVSFAFLYKLRVVNIPPGSYTLEFFRNGKRVTTPIEIRAKELTEIDVSNGIRPLPPKELDEDFVQHPSCINYMESIKPN